MDITPSLPKKNIFDNLDKIVKLEIEKGVIPSDAKWAVITAVDNTGVKLLAAVNFNISEGKINTKVKAIWEHDWDGNNTYAGQVVFSGK